MRLTLFTLCFLGVALLPPMFKHGVYQNDSGRWLFDTWYVITFLIVSFLFIHEFIHALSHDKAHPAEGKSDQKHSPHS